MTNQISPETISGWHSQQIYTPDFLRKVEAFRLELMNQCGSAIAEQVKTEPITPSFLYETGNDGVIGWSREVHTKVVRPVVDACLKAYNGTLSPVMAPGTSYLEETTLTLGQKIHTTVRPQALLRGVYEGLIGACTNGSLTKDSLAVARLLPIDDEEAVKATQVLLDITRSAFATSQNPAVKTAYAALFSGLGNSRGIDPQTGSEHPRRIASFPGAKKDAALKDLKILLLKTKHTAALDRKDYVEADALDALAQAGYAGLSSLKDIHMPVATSTRLAHQLHVIGEGAVDTARGVGAKRSLTAATVAALGVGGLVMPQSAAAAQTPQQSGTSSPSYRTVATGLTTNGQLDSVSSLPNPDSLRVVPLAVEHVGTVKPAKAPELRKQTQPLATDPSHKANAVSAPTLAPIPGTTGKTLSAQQRLDAITALAGTDVDTGGIPEKTPHAPTQRTPREAIQDQHTKSPETPAVASSPKTEPDAGRQPAPEAIKGKNKVFDALDKLVNEKGDKWQNRTIVIKALMNAGYSLEQACGMVGNFVVEAAGEKLNPAQEQLGGGSGRGIAQWGSTNPKYDRFGFTSDMPGFENFPATPAEGTLRWFAAQQGKDWRDINVQIAFVLYEFKNREKSASNVLRGADSLKESTEAGMAYERPATYVNRQANPGAYQSALNDRTKKSQQTYNDIVAVLGDAAPAPVAPKAAPSSSARGSYQPPAGATGCAPGTESLGKAATALNPQGIELCAVNGLRSSSEESRTRGNFAVKGANGRAIVNADASFNLTAMLEAARKDGVVIDLVTSSYRTNDHQQQLCTDSPEKCKKGLIAKPGKSDHNHEDAYAFDFNLGISNLSSICKKIGNVCTMPNIQGANIKAYNWLIKNAHSYGAFNLSTEFWHFSFFKNNPTYLNSPIWLKNHDGQPWTYTIPE